MRHNRNVTIPASIKPEGESVIAGFCSTIVSDIPIALSEEKKVMETCYWDYGTNNQFKAILY